MRKIKLSGFLKVGLFAMALASSGCGGSAGGGGGAADTDAASGSGARAGILRSFAAGAGDWALDAGLELQASDSEVSLVELAPPTVGASCDVLDDQHVNVALRDQVSAIGAPYQAAGIEYIQSVSANLVRIDPGTDLFGMLHMEVREDFAGLPGGTIGTSGSIDVSVITNSSTAVFYVFEFSSPVMLSAAETYHFVLVASGGYNGDASRQIRWVYDDVFGTNCGDPFSPLLTFDGDWSAFSRIPQFRLIEAAVHEFDRSAELAIDNGTDCSWDLSSFTVEENAHGETGRIVYDVGSGSDGVAVYAYAALTQAQVRAASGLDGRYLYVRARFEITGDGSKDATLGTLEVDCYE